MTATPRAATPSATPPVETPESQEDMHLLVAGQWQLMWWRFRKHKVAMVATAVSLLIYFVAVFAEFLAPLPRDHYAADYTFAPPQRIKLILEDEFGNREFHPHVLGYTVEIEAVALRRVFKPDPEQVIELGFFVDGLEEYRVLGIFSSRKHFFGPKDPAQPFYLFGADKLGQDLYSRLIFGTRISMTIGLVGVALSLIFGILLGGISGLFGGSVDNIIQRTIEFFRAVPAIPLWMALSAALPEDWDAIKRYFAITVILSILGWTGLARVVRGRFLSLREEDFVMSARLDGVAELGIILRYMLPSFLSHIIASVTLSIPGMILAETSLSFLGLGLRPPVVSWGVLLKDAQRVQVLATAPWLLIAAVPVIVSVLALNYVGDGLRDAADPYSR
ncbi:MAG: ABC transporter permease [Caldilineaceae bacterium]|nr:ABC transporter permease [Caldilineaceae bacterium]